MIRDTSAQDRAITPSAGAANKRRLWLIGGASVLVIAIAVSWPALSRRLGADQSVSGERLRIAEVRRGTLVRDVAVQGRVVAAVSPTLYAPVAGTVTLVARAGDTVTKNQVLVRVDSPELANELERERSTLAQSAAELGSARIAGDQLRLVAKREADEAEIALTAAKRELQRTSRAWDKKVVAEVEFLRAQDALRSAEIRNRNAAANADLSGQSAGFDRTTRQQQLERQRLLVENLERRVAELEIRAPVDGVIGTIAVADRTVVAANQALITVVDLRQLEVELPVPESYADDLGIGMSAEVRYASRVYPATLRAVSPEVVNGQVLARVRINGELPPGLRQNQRVSTRVLIEEKPNVLMVARGPFLDTGGGRTAYVVLGGEAVKRSVEIGSNSLSDVEIVSGLKAGERIVISDIEAFNGAERVVIND
ncbi:MAG: efflux RND transporter periplasmic adaptor subunit [Lysobacterales bacterium]